MTPTPSRTGSDRRQHKRIAADIVSRIVVGGVAIECNILDLSMGGAAVEAKGEMPQLDGRRVVLDIGGILTIKCKIVRRFSNGIAVSFYSNDLRQAGAKERLAELMEAHDYGYSAPAIKYVLER